jgi:hypothetical protein
MNLEPGDAFDTLKRFSGQNLAWTLSRIEQSLVGATAENCDLLLLEQNALHNALA